MGISNSRLTAEAAVYFFLSTVITWYFIDCGSDLYHFDQGKMILSCSIAGAKWAIQIFAGLLFLGERKWLFIRNIALTCFVGSCILLPYCFTPVRSLLGESGFLLSLIAAVAAMLFMYYVGVRRAGVATKWYFLWIACLATAVTLQLTVVFHVI